MRTPYTQIFVHLGWATWNRLPLLTPEAQQLVSQSFRTECEALKAELISVGGTADHVHLLVRFPTMVSIGRLVQQLKRVHPLA